LLKARASSEIAEGSKTFASSVMADADILVSLFKLLQKQHEVDLKFGMP